ncbi:MAG: dynamin family protein [Synergistaceae bacterium]|nr:dynamin family protein [Synergistaceae bacterium]
MPVKNLSQWERDNFSGTAYTPDLTVIFPSREIYLSSALLNVMHFSSETCPSTLDQWYELCHPEDHAKLSTIERAIYGHEDSLSITRKLYCGDGVYRAFRLDALILRDSNKRPVKLIGRETSALTAWLECADDGDVIECGNRMLEAVMVQGVMTLRDRGEIEDMQAENLRLRREIQKRIFSPLPSVLPEFVRPEGDTFLRNTLEENISLALNVLTGNSQLKALRRSLNIPSLTVGVCGLTGSGKSSFVNALLGERLIPEGKRSVFSPPVFCREGEGRSALVHYQDGRSDAVRGGKLTASRMREIHSTTGVARVEITMPGALIPSGMCFADTPGYDAITGSGGAYLRNILPELDMIIYVVPVRSRLKGSDYEYLKLIMSMNSRIIFVVSQTDLECDDSEAGRVVHTAGAKIEADILALRNDLKRFCGQDFMVVPVSARNALDKFYDRNSPLWSGSNVEEVVKFLADSQESPFMFRAERTLKILEGALAGGGLTGSSRWRLQDYAGNLRKILQGRDNEPSHKYSFTWSIKPEQREGRNLLHSLITSLREHDFRTRFFALEAFRKERNAVLLGADRSQSLKLLARLAHNLAYENLPQGSVSSGEWLSSGNDIPFGCIRLPVIREGENFLIAPSDTEIMSNPDWHSLFKKFTPVVSVDLARIDSGLSDLSHSPYLTGLALNDWVLSFGNAGLFGTRQKDLVQSVPERVREFVEASGLKSPNWFIFENYRIF